MANHIHRKNCKQVALNKHQHSLRNIVNSQCVSTCGLCYAACPQFGLNPEFLGPAAITMAHRYNLDNRDHGKAKRMSLLNGKNGVWSCTFVGYCSEVCPKHVDPASAINQGKVESAKDYVISMLKPKS